MKATTSKIANGTAAEQRGGARPAKSRNRTQRITREQLVEQVGELEQENESLRQRITELKGYMTLAYRDALTGLRNRRYFEKRMAEEINRVGREQGQVFSLLLVDIDDFKQINDTRGHAVGDDTLRWVARFIENSVREHDVCCRYAGDEFVVILPQSGAQSCTLLIERLRERLETVKHWSGVPLQLSIGAATFGVDGVTLEEMFGAADRRMYADKRAHKGWELADGGTTGQVSWTGLVGGIALGAARRDH